MTAVVAHASIIGTIPSWGLLVIALLAAYRVTKGGGGSAVSELSAANTVLDKRLHEQGAEIRDLRIKNTELEAKTDFTIALAPIFEWTASHEIRAQERHEKTMIVLDLIAQRLGKEEE